MNINEKVTNVIKNDCCLDITSYINVPGLKKAYIQLAEYKFSRKSYETSCNNYIEEKDLEKYISGKILEIEKGLKEGYLGLDTESVVLEFNDTNGETKTISINSSEWLSVYFD